MADFEFIYTIHAAEAVPAKHVVFGYGNDAGEAKAMADSIIAMTVGIGLSAWSWERVTAGLAAPATGSYTDAEITLEHFDLNRKRKLQIENLAHQFFDTVGNVDKFNGAIVAIKDAFRDDDGNSGYVITRSKVI